MSTRSLTVINDQEGSEIVVMYRHCDGYPEVHGVELTDFLKGIVITKGISVSHPTEHAANGMEELAAQIVSHFKTHDTRGNFYLHPAGTRNFWEDFIYELSQQEDRVHMRITSHNTVIFDDLVDNFELEAL